MPCTFDWFILTFEHFEYGLTKLPTLKKYNKWCILTFNYKVALILNGLDHSGIAKHNVTSSLLHVTQQLPIQIPPPQRIFLCVKKWRGQENLDFFYKLFKTRVFFILIWYFEDQTNNILSLKKLTLHSIRVLLSLKSLNTNT